MNTDISQSHLERLEQPNNDDHFIEENHHSPNSLLNNYTALSGIKQEMFDESQFSGKPTQENNESAINDYGTDQYGEEESQEEAKIETIRKKESFGVMLDKV